MHGDVAVLDPFKRVSGETREYCTGYNPMKKISVHETDADIDRAGMIADGLILYVARMYMEIL